MLISIFPMNVFPSTDTFPSKIDVLALFVKCIDIDDGIREYTVYRESDM